MECPSPRTSPLATASVNLLLAFRGGSVGQLPLRSRFSTCRAMNTAMESRKVGTAFASRLSSLRVVSKEHVGGGWLPEGARAEEAKQGRSPVTRRRIVESLEWPLLAAYHAGERNCTQSLEGGTVGKQWDPLDVDEATELSLEATETFELTPLAVGAVEGEDDCSDGVGDTAAASDSFLWTALTKSVQSVAEEWKETPLAAVGLLNLVAVIWGSQHAVIKMVVDDTDASLFSFLRFGVATLLVAPYTPSLSFLAPQLQKWLSSNSSTASRGRLTKKKSSIMLQPEDAMKEDWGDSDAPQSTLELTEFNGYDGASLESGVWNEETTASDASADSDKDAMMAWRWGLEMGLWMFLGYAFQAVGLESTTAQRSGFLLYLNVKFVPFFAWALLGRQIGIATWVSAFTALLGTGLLACGDSLFGGAVAGVPLNVGDAWSVAAAAASAMFILRLESASNAVKDSSALNASSLWVVTVLSLVWCLFAVDGHSSSSSSLLWTQLLDTVTSHPVEILYLSGVTTALTNYLQTKAQKLISAERASVIYAMDPVYGAAFANVLLGEALGYGGMAGAALITVAAATSAFVDVGRRNDPTEAV